MELSRLRPILDRLNKPLKKSKFTAYNEHFTTVFVLETDDGDILKKVWVNDNDAANLTNTEIIAKVRAYDHIKR